MSCSLFNWTGDFSRAGSIFFVFNCHGYRCHGNRFHGNFGSRFFWRRVGMAVGHAQSQLLPNIFETLFCPSESVYSGFTEKLDYPTDAGSVGGHSSGYKYKRVPSLHFSHCFGRSTEGLIVHVVVNGAISKYQAIGFW